ncbi:IS200/IS605 family transposase [Candidatus Woesearchaeota archaeon]|nr:IS200/IS605 family transposase [Candidatus Woesearchaeota archaeon]
MNIYQQNTHAHSIGWSTYHFEWCTKYRYKIFKQSYIKNLCLIAIIEAAKKHKINILEIEVDMDHIHVIVSLSMTMNPSKALNLMKGLSAHLLFKLLPNLRKRYRKGHLWSRGKFAASVGHITLENAKKYLEDHHAKEFSKGISTP